MRAHSILMQQWSEAANGSPAADEASRAGRRAALGLTGVVRNTNLRGHAADPVASVADGHLAPRHARKKKPPLAVLRPHCSTARGTGSKPTTAHATPAGRTHDTVVTMGSAARNRDLGLGSVGLADELGAAPRPEDVLAALAARGDEGGGEAAGIAQLAGPVNELGGLLAINQRFSEHLRGTKHAGVSVRRCAAHEGRRPFLSIHWSFMIVVRGRAFSAGENARFMPAHTWHDSAFTNSS